MCLALGLGLLYNNQGEADLIFSSFYQQIQQERSDHEKMREIERAISLSLIDEASRWGTRPNLVVSDGGASPRLAPSYTRSRVQTIGACLIQYYATHRPQFIAPSIEHSSWPAIPWPLNLFKVFRVNEGNFHPLNSWIAELWLLRAPILY